MGGCFNWKRIIFIKLMHFLKMKWLNYVIKLVTMKVNKMGVLEILTIVFVVLKFAGVISWSWWLVLLPVLIAVSGYLLVVGAWILMFVIGFVIAWKHRDR